MRAPLPTTFLSTAFAAVLLASAPTSPLHAEEKRELGAHEHGHVEWQIAIEGNDVTMTLEAPGSDIVGFEHDAKTDEQKAAIEAATTQLTDAAALFTLTEAAGCTVGASDVELHQEGDHNAFEASYTFACTDIAALTGVQTNLFTLYPSIEEIEVEYATPAGQGSAELEADDPSITFPASS